MEHSNIFNEMMPDLREVAERLRDVETLIASIRVDYQHVPDAMLDQVQGPVSTAVETLQAFIENPVVQS